MTGQRRLLAGGAAALLALGVVTALLTPPTTRTYLDPAAATPGGTRALAEVLREQGVSVERSTDAAQVLDAGTGAGEHTVVVAYPELLSPAVLGRLEQVSADVVLLGAPVQAPDYLGVTPVAAVEVQSRAPECGLTAATSAGAALTGGVAYRVGDTPDLDPLGTPALCYLSGAGATVVQVTTATGHRHTIVGSADFMTNDRFADDGNAALALNLLGSSPEVVWWLPTPAYTGTQSLTSLLPSGLWPVLGGLVMTVLLIGLWQGRRLGPVVAEPLPVAVRASETTEGRAQLYQRHRSQEQAAHHLRRHGQAALRRRLGLPPHTDDDVLVRETARVTGRTESDVRAVLYGPSPDSDGALVTLAQQLSALEQEAGRP